MTENKIVLHFPPHLVDKPLIYRLSRDFDLEFNILKASVTPQEEGILVLELKGKDEDYKRAIEYLKENGVEVQPLTQDINLNYDLCTHCGLCLPICPVEALVKDSETEEIKFIKERCIACELCVKVCPYKAIEVSIDV
jgi:ferredoxin